MAEKAQCKVIEWKGGTWHRKQVQCEKSAGFGVDSAYCKKHEFHGGVPEDYPTETWHVVWLTGRNVDKVEVVNETKVMVDVVRRWSGETHVRREKKNTQWNKYVKTKEEAFECLKSLLEEDIDSAKKALKTAQEKMEKLHEAYK